MKSIPTTIIGHEPNGKCSLTGKDGTECFIVRIGHGEPKLVSVSRLIEILRWNCSISIKPNLEPTAMNKEAEK